MAKKTDPNPDDMTDEQLDKMFDERHQEAASEPEPPVEQPKADEPGPPEEKPSEEPPEGEDEHKQVPYAALAEERRKRQERDRQIEELTGKVGKMESVFARLQDATKPEEPKEAPPPDPREKPLDAIEYLNRKVSEAEAREKQTAAQRAEAEQNAKAWQEFTNKLDSIEAEFAKDAPDYFDAVAFAKQARADELAMFGYTAQQAQEMAMRDAVQLANLSMRNNRNPAEVFYNYAQKRGYQRRAAGNGNGTEILTDADRQAMLERTRSLGGMPGSAPRNKMTLEQIADLPDDEFAKYLEHDWQELRKMIS